MNRTEYRNKIKGHLEAILDNSTFKNVKSQLYAKSIGAELRETYTEGSVYEDAYNLAFHACTLLLEDFSEKDLLLRALKESSEVFELLGRVGQEIDKEFCLILAAFCSDVAGYSANALCIVRDIEKYELSESLDLVFKETEDDFVDKYISDDLKETNNILQYFLLFLQKKIPLTTNYINQVEPQRGWAEKSFSSLKLVSEQILTGKDNNYFPRLFEAYVKSFEASDSTLSLLFLALLGSKWDAPFQD